MEAIRFECPHCREMNTGDESLYGRQVTCRRCQKAMLVPQAPGAGGLQTARLIRESEAAHPGPDGAEQETEVFNLRPVVRSFAGRIGLGVILIALGAFVAMRAEAPWLRWVGLALLATGVILLALVWIGTKSYRYRLTSQRLFVRRGWLAKHVNELELYRVKDVVVDQGVLQRMLGYGTITVLAEDQTTPKVSLAGISRPVEVKETIRTRYREVRRREGMVPREFLESS